MRTVGIIAEYNPFHNGHAYQIAKAKEITAADYCIVVMSGNFVQRGTPAIINKYLRTQAALANGADLVIELPVHFASGSAEYFASGAIAILDKIGVTDCLCFGSECGDIHALTAISQVFISENNEFKKILKQQMKAGYSYPKARNDALIATEPHLIKDPELLSSPNNILGLEYLKALKKRNSRIEPYTISRTGSDYHDTGLNAPYSSALAIRESITMKQDISLIKDQVPAAVYTALLENYGKTFPILPEDIYALLQYKLFMEQEKGFTKYFDIDSDFSDRLKNLFPYFTEYTALCETLKSKNTTYTKVSRNLLHILLNIYQEDLDIFCSEDYVYYARMLGFKKDAGPLLSAIKSNASIPLLSKLADAINCISSENGKRMLHQDIEASHIYDLLIHQKFHQNPQNEYAKPIVIV